jgi:hypothetical protein
MEPLLPSVHTHHPQGSQKEGASNLKTGTGQNRRHFFIGFWSSHNPLPLYQRPHSAKPVQACQPEHNPSNHSKCSHMRRLTIPSTPARIASRLHTSSPEADVRRSTAHLGHPALPVISHANVHRWHCKAVGRASIVIHRLQHRHHIIITQVRLTVRLRPTDLAEPHGQFPSHSWSCRPQPNRI